MNMLYLINANTINNLRKCNKKSGNYTTVQQKKLFCKLFLTGFKPTNGSAEIIYHFKVSYSQEFIQLQDLICKIFCYRVQIL